LLNHLEDEVLEEIKGMMGKLPDEIMRSQDGLNENAATIIMDFFRYIQANRRFFNLVVAENGDPAFLGKLGDTIRDMIHRGLPQEILPMPERYLVAIIVGVQTGIIREWIGSGMKETPEELAAILTMVIRDVPKNLLAR